MSIANNEHSDYYYDKNQTVYYFSLLFKEITNLGRDVA